MRGRVREIEKHSFKPNTYRIHLLGADPLCIRLLDGGL